MFPLRVKEMLRGRQYPIVQVHSPVPSLQSPVFNIFPMGVLFPAMADYNFIPGGGWFPICITCGFTSPGSTKVFPHCIASTSVDSSLISPILEANIKIKCSKKTSPNKIGTALHPIASIGWFHIKCQLIMFISSCVPCIKCHS